MWHCGKWNCWQGHRPLIIIITIILLLLYIIIIIIYLNVMCIPQLGWSAAICGACLLGSSMSSHGFDPIRVSCHSVLRSWPKSLAWDVKDQFRKRNEHTEIYGYGSIPINSQLLGGWTSINPGYFDVNRRGTIGFDTLPYEVIEAHSISNAAPKLDGDNDKAAFPAGSWDSDRSVVDCAAREGLRVGCWEISALDQWNCNSRTTETLGVSYQII